MYGSSDMNLGDRFGMTRWQAFRPCHRGCGNPHGGPVNSASSSGTAPDPSAGPPASSDRHWMSEAPACCDNAQAGSDGQLPAVDGSRCARIPLRSSTFHRPCGGRSQPADRHACPCSRRAGTCRPDAPVGHPARPGRHSPTALPAAVFRRARTRAAGHRASGHCRRYVLRHRAPVLAGSAITLAEACHRPPHKTDTRPT